MKGKTNMWHNMSIVLIVALLHLLIQFASAQGNEVTCQNIRGERGVCINIRRCQPLFEILQTQGRAAAEYLRSTVCGYEGRDPRVCCILNNNNQNNNDNNNVNNDNTDVDDIQVSPYGPLKAPYCGSSNVSLTRVVGGVKSKLGSWPWITSLGYLNRANPNSPKFLCGGTLISSRHVLTAGHCVYHRSDLYMVRIADLDLKNNNDGARPIDVDVEKIILHPDYNPRIFTNDIAILRLQSEVPFSALLHPICLPTTREMRNQNLDEAFPFVVGFGATGYNQAASSHLMEVQVPLMSTAQCKKNYAKISNTLIDERVMCAGKIGKDACQGDSGGPLMYAHNSRFYIIGVVSYGYRCAEPDYPGIYTRVTAFLDFITNNLV